MNSPLRTRRFPPDQQRERKAEQRFHEEWDKGHGRREHRTIETTTALNSFLQQQLGWSSIRQVFRITRIRFLPNPQTGQWERSTEVAYGITSLSRAQADAKQLLAYNRGHWGIENRLHYVRDVTFGEDQSRIRSGHGPQHLAAARNAAIALCRRNHHQNLAEARREFAWNPQRLFTILGYITN